MKRFICFFVTIFAVFVLSVAGLSPEAFAQNEVQAEDSYYSISYNSIYGMYQADFHGTSRDIFVWCILDMYCNYGGGGIINLDSDLYVTSHIDISTGHLIINGNGHKLVNAGSTYIFLALDNIFKICGDANVTFNGVVLDGCGLCYNSAELPGSIIELTSGNPNLILNDCSVCNVKNSTAFDKSQPLGGGTGINAWYGKLVCNNTSFYNISGACIYESSIGSTYDCGRCNVILNNCTSKNVSSIFSSGTTLVDSHSLTINGGDYKCGGDSEYVTYCLAMDLGNINNDSICSSINSANIVCENGEAIANYGIMNVKDSDIIAHSVFAAISNVNKLSINNTKIHDSSTGVYNMGELSLLSGSIYSNYWYGIYNVGDVIQLGGNIHSNGGDTPEGQIGGVYQDGTYYIKDKAEISSNNSVLLVGQHIIDVDYKYMDIDSKSRLDNYSPIVITLESNEREIGRKLVNVEGINNSSSSEYQALFKLAFNNPNYNSNGGNFDGVKNSASVRSGDKIYNHNLNGLYLSGKYYLNYDNKFDGYNRTKLNYSREFDEFYWLENADIDFSSISYNVDYEGKDVTNSFLLKSFVIDNEIYPVQNTCFTDREKWSGNRNCRGVFDVRFNIDFDGNGGKTLDDKTEYIIYNVGDDLVFPDYVFYKEPEMRIRNSIIDNQEKCAAYKYSQQGWSVRADAIYSDEDNIKCGTGISLLCDNITDFLLGALEEGNVITGEGFVTIKYYATWDEYPVIDNIDVAIPIEDVDKVDEAYLISKAKIASIDKEDNGNIAIGIEGFNKSELDSLGVGESITFNIFSVDGVSNITYAPLTIRISSNKPIKRRTNIRYVDLDSIHTSEEDGGLMDNSKWFAFL